VASSELKFSEKIAKKQSELVISSIPYKFHLERIYMISESTLQAFRKVAQFDGI